MGDVLDRLAGFPKSALTILLSALILLSLGSIHYVTYVFAFPSHLRALLDSTFKLDFATNFAIVATFSIVVARYLPQTLLAIGAAINSSLISIAYYRRGYRRIAISLGLFEKERRNNKEERWKFERRLATFGRNDARMDNFVRRVLQRRLPILWYERHKWTVMANLAVFICLLFYVGVLYSLWLLTVFLLVSSAYETYNGYSDNFRFSLRGFRFSGDDPDHEPSPVKFDSDRLFVIATTCAVIFAVAGPLRLWNQTEGAKAKIDKASTSLAGVIIGNTSEGILVYEDDFAFIPFSAIQEVR
jgi:hypothetical protein